jgi:hypothetical protein
LEEIKTDAREQGRITQIFVFHFSKNRGYLLGRIYGIDCRSSKTAGRQG